MSKESEEFDSYEICDASKISLEESELNQLEQKVLSPDGIPVSFEYSYDPSNAAFKDLILVENACPYHEKHLRPKAGGDVLSFFLVDESFDLINDLQEA